MKILKKRSKEKKGFTLVELLASVLILALIVIIVVPLTLNSLNKAKEKQLENSVSVLEVWLGKQYDLYKFNESSASIDFINFCEQSPESTLSCRSNIGVRSGSDESATISLSLSNENTNAIKLLKASGLNPNNFSYVKVNYNNNYNKLCVNLTASDSGEFKEYAGKMKKSSGCA